MPRRHKAPLQYTKPEIAMFQLLTDMDVRFNTQVGIKTRFREWPFYVDFLIPPKIVVEVDGSYWHSKKTRRRKDEVKDNCLTAEGYKVIHVTDKDVLYNPKYVTTIIKQALKETGYVSLDNVEPR